MKKNLCAGPCFLAAPALKIHSAVVALMDRLIWGFVLLSTSLTHRLEGLQDITGENGEKVGQVS